MDATKCRVLLSAVESGSLTAAAEALGYTASGVSRMMSALEEECGFPLFRRVRGGMEPTGECLRLLPVMRRLVSCEEQLGDMSRELAGLAAGSLRVGVSFGAAQRLLPAIAGAFLKEYPEIELHTVEGGGGELCGLMEQRVTDICIMSRRLGCGRWTPIMDVPLATWLPASHPMAGLSAFPLKSCASEPFIMTLPGRDTDAEVLLERCGIAPEVRFATLDSAAAWSMVEAGLGISLSDAVTSQGRSGSVKVLPLEPPQKISVGIAVPQPEALSPAAEKFIASAVKTAAAMQVSDFIF